MTVVDASVAVHWFVEASRTQAAVALLDGEEILLAPDLVVAEVVNTAWKLVRAGEISRDHGAQIAAGIASCFTHLVPSTELSRRAYELAVELEHPVYDCLYLALAEQHTDVVVTVDRRLLSKLEGTTHSHLARPLSAE